MQGMKAWLADKQPSFVGILQSLKTTKTTGGMIPLTNEASKPELQRHLSMNYTTSNIKLSFLIQQTTACDNHPSQSLALLTSRQTLTILSFYPLPVIFEVLLAMFIANVAHGLHSCQGTFEVVSCSNECNCSLVIVCSCAIYLVVPVQTTTFKQTSNTPSILYKSLETCMVTSTTWAESMKIFWYSMSLILGVFDQQEMHMVFVNTCWTLATFPRFKLQRQGSPSFDRPQFPGAFGFGFREIPEKATFATWRWTHEKGPCDPTRFKKKTSLWKWTSLKKKVTGTKRLCEVDVNITPYVHHGLGESVHQGNIPKDSAGTF